MIIFEKLLQDKLTQKIGRPVDLSITDNVSSMIYVRRNGKGYSVRLHHMFIDADISIIDDIAQFVRTGRSNLIQKFIDEHTFLIRTPSQKKEPRISTTGQYYDLKKIYNDLNRKYFKGKVSCTITWGRRRRRKGRRSIQFGCYYDTLDLIRINPRLDSPRVPRYFIKYIVFHEMLHSIFNPGSPESHTKAFKEKEREFKYFHKAAAWQEKNLSMFIR